MLHVVCQVVTAEDRVSFTWSEGAGSFPPYHLTGQCLADFRNAARQARECLRDLVDDYLKGSDEDVRRSSLAQAQAGYKLYQAVFRPDASQARVAKDVREWLGKLQSQNAVGRLEVVLEGARLVPWNVVYDTRPDEKAFLAGAEAPDRWLPFWGLRYNLAGGRRVDPLRRLPLLERPSVLLAVDPEVFAGLPPEQRGRLDEFARKRGLPVARSRDELARALEGGRPDLLYWLGHADPEALELGGEKVRPGDLLGLLRGDDFGDDARVGGLAFLNACQTGEEGPVGSFLDALHDFGLSGLIATEQQTVDTFACPFGLDFLEAFLDRGEPIGRVLHTLRGRVPLGLLDAAYCPPDIRVRPPDGAPGGPAPAVGQAPRVAGVSLGAAAVAREPAPLPERPYRSLAHYGREDRALFAGRDADVLRFAQVLDAPATRLVLLHGESGVGKTSFLQAGVIPYLEEECVGFRFARDRSSGGGEPVLFVRATNDLVGQLAQALCRYCARPYAYTTPAGEPVEVDLPTVLQATPTPEALRAALWADPELLGRLLGAVAEKLPHALVLVVDQAEEVFTLARTPADDESRVRALEMLRHTAEARSGEFKVILALRTEYFGRVVDALRRGGPAFSVREYLLTDFAEDRLAEAIVRPTGFARYAFRYAGGVAERLARDIVAYCRNRQDSVLPLAQVICAQLYEAVKRREGTVVGADDVASLGGLEGGLKRHVEALLTRHLPDPEDQVALRRLLTGLYLRQPDGVLTTALMPLKDAVAADNDAEHQWAGPTPLADLLPTVTRPAVRLLRLSTLRLGGAAERVYVSLGHDALAGVAAEWDEEFSRWDRLRKLLLWLGGLTAVAVSFALLAVLAWGEKTKAEQAAEAAREAERGSRRSLYSAHMNLARQAWNQADMMGLAKLLNGQRPEQAGEELRGFEWYYWWRLCHMASATLTGHRGAVLSVAWAPGRPVLASGGEDATIRVWDAGRKSERHTLRGHGGPVWAVAFDPGGKSLASGSLDGTVRLWDARTGEGLATLGKPGAAPVWSVAFSPDGKLLASGGQDGKVRLWDVAERRERRTFDPHYGGRQWVRSVAFSPDGKLLAGATAAGSVTMWQMPTGKVAPRYLWVRSGHLWGVAFSRDSRTLAVAAGNQVSLYRTGGGGPETLTGYGDHVTSVAFRGDGDLVTGSLDWTVRVRERWGSERLRTFRGHTDGVIGVAAHPDSPLLASASRDGTVKVWALAEGCYQETPSFRILNPPPATLSEGGKEGIVSTRGQGVDFDKALRHSSAEPVRVSRAGGGREVVALRGQPTPLAVIGFSGNGKRFVAACNGPVELWDLASGKVVRTAWGWPRDTWAVDLSHDGELVVAAGGDGKILLWDVRTDKKQVANRAGAGPIWCVALSPDGRRFALGDDGAVSLWDVPSRRQLATLPGPPGRVWSAAFHPRGTVLAAGGEDGAVRLWDTVTGKARGVLSGHQHRVWCVAFDRGGERVVSASEDGAVRVWDVKTGEVLQTFRGHSGPVWAAAFTPDGKRVASAGKGRTVRLWDLNTGHELLTLREHQGPVWAVRFSPDGTTLLSGSADGVVKLWRAAPTDQPDPPAEVSRADPSGR